jgi:hypothetical protein
MAEMRANLGSAWTDANQLQAFDGPAPETINVSVKGGTCTSMHTVCQAEMLSYSQPVLKVISAEPLFAAGGESWQKLAGTFHSRNMCHQSSISFHLAHKSCHSVPQPVSKY